MQHRGNQIISGTDPCHINPSPIKSMSYKLYRQYFLNLNFLLYNFCCCYIIFLQNYPNPINFECPCHINYIHMSYKILYHLSQATLYNCLFELKSPFVFPTQISAKTNCLLEYWYLTGYPFRFISSFHCLHSYIVFSAIYMDTNLAQISARPSTFAYLCLTRCLF